MNLWESVKELIYFCQRVEFVHIYAQQKLIFVDNLFESANDVLGLHISAYVCTMSRESASMYENLLA